MLVKISLENLRGAISRAHDNFEFIAVYRAETKFHVGAHALPLPDFSPLPHLSAFPSYVAKRQHDCEGNW
jgi:hypothetical protein